MEISVDKKRKKKKKISKLSRKQRRKPDLWSIQEQYQPNPTTSVAKVLGGNKQMDFLNKGEQGNE
jgi:hypothetical protein